MRRYLGCIAIVLVPACGVERVAGYVDELERESLGSSGTGETGTASSGSGDGTGSSGVDDTTGQQTTGTSTGASGTGDTSDATAGAGTTDGTTTDGSTGAPTPVCGDGVLELVGPEPEECDDGNLDPDDGCSETCALDRRVFVTSERYQSGAIGGVYSANARCANLADDQGWPEPLRYRAWLSDSSADARDNIVRGRGRLVLANGLVFAESWSALLAGQIENPLEVTEKFETYQNGVWTGTRPDGTAVPGSEHCGDWMSNSFLKTGVYGDSRYTTTWWTEDQMPGGCGAEFAIYCMQSL